MTTATGLIIALLVSIGFIILIVYFIKGAKLNATDQEIDFDLCKQMREDNWEEEDITNMMRAPGNYYDKDYE